MACLRLLWVRAEVGGRCLPELFLEKVAVFCGQSFSVHGRVIVEALQVLKPSLSLNYLVELRVKPDLSRSCTECRPQSVLVRLFRWSLVHYSLESVPVSTLQSKNGVLVFCDILLVCINVGVTLSYVLQAGLNEEKVCSIAEDDVLPALEHALLNVIELLLPLEGLWDEVAVIATLCVADVVELRD